jgi:hypothetical protein
VQECRVRECRDRARARFLSMFLVRRPLCYHWKATVYMRRAQKSVSLLFIRHPGCYHAVMPFLRLLLPLHTHQQLSCLSIRQQRCSCRNRDCCSSSLPPFCTALSSQVNEQTPLEDAVSLVA